LVKRAKTTFRRKEKKKEYRLYKLEEIMIRKQKEICTRNRHGIAQSEENYFVISMNYSHKKWVQFI